MVADGGHAVVIGGGSGGRKADMNREMRPTSASF
jgi:hypothetical protein